MKKNKNYLNSLAGLICWGIIGFLALVFIFGALGLIGGLIDLIF